MFMSFILVYEMLYICKTNNKMPKNNPQCIRGALGAVSIRKTVLPGMAIPMLKIRRPNGRLIFNMEIAIRRYDGLYIETGPWLLNPGKTTNMKGLTQITCLI